HLERFGGNRAAAGLSIDPTKLEDFAEAFGAYADEALAPEDLVSLTVVDAVVGAEDLTLELAEELARLGPFGLGNPEVTLLVPAAEIVSPSTVGDGKHLRFRVRDERGRDAGTAIAFGQGGQLDRFRTEGLFDIAFRLRANAWNGTTAPQLVVRRIAEADDRYVELRSWLVALWRAGEDAWTPEARRVFSELRLGSATARRPRLLDSETFRALLGRAPLERAA
ncbi:MAG: hypothetical protein RMM28_05960, partial [Thermoleophilia bacterium]|nr:hypothetical protein [Thermoleophilia bacterium]